MRRLGQACIQELLLLDSGDLTELSETSEAEARAYARRHGWSRDRWKPLPEFVIQRILEEIEKVGV